MDKIIKKKKNKEAAKKCRDKHKQKEIDLQTEITMLRKEISRNKKKREKLIHINNSLQINQIKLKECQFNTIELQKLKEFQELKKQLETHSNYITELEQFIIRNVKLF